MRQLSGTNITIIAVSFMVLLGVLTFTHQDTAAFIAVGGSILGALGVGVSQLAQVKQNTNGNNARLQDHVESLTSMVAASSPNPEVLAMVRPSTGINEPTTVLPLLPGGS